MLERVHPEFKDKIKNLQKKILKDHKIKVTIPTITKLIGDYIDWEEFDFVQHFKRKTKNTMTGYGDMFRGKS